LIAGRTGQEFIDPVVKQLNYKRQFSIKLNTDKGFVVSTTGCFRYFVTGAIIRGKAEKALSGRIDIMPLLLKLSTIL
jgi:hypothetical protein